MVLRTTTQNSSVILGQIALQFLKNGLSLLSSFLAVAQLSHDPLDKPAYHRKSMDTAIMELDSIRFFRDWSTSKRHA